MSQQPLEAIETSANSTSVTQLELSGAQWVERFPTSKQTSDLITPFRTNVENFISALEASGATVDIAATLRPPERAFLMHYCARIASGQLDPQNVPANEKINIDWVHRYQNGQVDLERSIRAARAMKNGYQIVYPPALTSRHSQGRAIDMRVDNFMNKLVKNAQGVDTLITSSIVLYQIGQSYNVRKLVSDPPHWSDDGH